MDHAARARALAQLPVLPQLYRRVVYIYIGVNERTNRSVGIEGFATTKLLLLFLQVAIGDVESDCVTKDPTECILRRDVLRARADHDSQFGFKIGLMLGKRHFDDAFMRQ